jgi:acetate kinase
VTAVKNGKSVDTSMGFTPLEGVPMATRAGSLDPGALLYLLRHGVSLDELDHALEHESGLLGLAGSGDVAALEHDAFGVPSQRRGELLRFFS